MAIYRMDNANAVGELVAIAPTTFAAKGIDERKGLQDKLKKQIGILFPDENGVAQKDAAMIVAEEFSDFDGSKRRIDLLALDRNGNLVVIELKRTEDGNHMELQALRYAAMVATMTFETLVKTHAAYAGSDEDDARAEIEKFLGKEFKIENFNTRTHIILASADFSKELMTTILWLNEAYGMGIRCVRMKPYADSAGGEESVLLDIHPLVPLPEAEQYLIGTNRKAREQQDAKTSRQQGRFSVAIDGEETVSDLRGKRAAILYAIKAILSRAQDPEAVGRVVQPIKPNIFRRFEGTPTVEEIREILRSESGDAVPEGSKLDKRYYLGPDDVFRHGGASYVLTNQWGARFGDVIAALHIAYDFVTVTGDAVDDDTGTD